MHCGVQCRACTTRFLADTSMASIFMLTLNNSTERRLMNFQHVFPLAPSWWLMGSCWRDCCVRSCYSHPNISAGRFWLVSYSGTSQQSGSIQLGLFQVGFAIDWGGSLQAKATACISLAFHTSSGSVRQSAYMMTDLLRKCMHIPRGGRMPNAICAGLVSCVTAGRGCGQASQARGLMAGTRLTHKCCRHQTSKTAPARWIRHPQQERLPGLRARTCSFR